MRSAITRLQCLRGWLSFVLVFSLDAIGNVGVTFGQEFNWGLSAPGGILVGMVWNYAVTSSYT